MFVLLIILSVVTMPTTGRCVYFQAANCSQGPDFVSYLKLFIKNNAINMDLVTVKPLITGMMGHIDFEMRAPNSNKYQRLFQHDVNYCNMLIKDNKSIFKRWFQSVLKHGNFSALCPIAPATYYLHNWLITADLVPSYLSIPGEYRVKARAFYRKNKTKHEDLVLECVLYATIK